MSFKRIIPLTFIALLAVGCGENGGNTESSDKSEHVTILQTCAADIKELNKGKPAAPTREIVHNVDILPGTLQFPTMFCYYASLLSEMDEFDIEKDAVQFTADIEAFGGKTTTIIYNKFYKGRFYVYTAQELLHDDEPYLVYQIFDCHYNQSNKKMVNFVYYLGNQYGNPLLGAYEYKSNVYNCYYKRSEDDEALQDSHFQKLIDDYQNLEANFNTLIEKKVVVEDKTTIQKCVDKYAEAFDYVCK